MGSKRILIIGLVWPEPVSSAAGTRMVQLVNTFLSAHYEVCFASAASKSQFSYDLKSIGVTEQQVHLNDESFNLFVKEINPDVVLFDRYMTEEQYGWRVQQECPDAIKILDTEDLHFLRYARREALKTGQPLHIFTETAKREIAAILRSDLSLIISETEIIILRDQFRIDPSLLYYLPFLEDELTASKISNFNSFEEREGFVFIGNYLHEPNWHTLQYLKTRIWPVLRKLLPQAFMHIYGAYPSQKVTQLHNAKENFLVHGRAKDANAALASHKVLLAPIQFGAGVKGKFIDAMQTGTPAVTTTVGAEAMKGGLDWNGAIADNAELFADEAVKLYLDKKYWLKSQKNGILILNERYGKSKFTVPFMDMIGNLSTQLPLHRNHNFTGQILQHHTASSTKYMSLWIEEKHRKKK
jgi:glycosyltransferase involved in cell wall biosynthesis